MPRKATTFNLPEGVTLEMLDEYARQRTNARRRAEYARDPDRVTKYRLATYTNFMQRNGMLVIPMPPALPWSDLQQKCVMQMVKKAMEQQGGRQDE